MPDTMIERVARAIHKNRQGHGYGGAADWDFEPQDIQRMHLDTARAVLAVMRESTEAIVEAGVGSWGRNSQCTLGQIVRAQWPAMIDAALKEGCNDGIR